MCGGRGVTALVLGKEVGERKARKHEIEERKQQPY